MTTEATIDYDTLHQEALRGLVKTVLIDVTKSGLPGDHHFYISYDVKAPGVALSKRLREKYPTEMTIVLQHRFWDLAVSDDRFEVKLSFDGIPERLVVPFSAIKVFIDPSAKFVLQFDEHIASDGGDAAEARNGVRRRTARPGKSRVERTAAPANLQIATSDQRPALPRPKSAPAPVPALAPPALAPPALAPSAIAAASPPSRGDTEKPSDDPTPSPGPGAQVVSLDAFRKK